MGRKSYFGNCESVAGKLLIYTDPINNLFDHFNCKKVNIANQKI